MMISGISRTVSLSVYRLDVVATASAGVSAPSAATGTAAPVDRVTLSPTATGGAASAEEPGDDTTAAPLAPSSSRTNALFAALDADDDGAISENEFSEGARRLLTRGHRHAHGHDRDRDRERNGHRVDGDGHRHYGRHGRLERRLERLFDRVDGNGDGAIDRDELTSALAPRQPQPQPAEGEGAAAVATGVTVSVSFTVVSVAMAVHRYAAAQSAAAPDAGTPTASPVDRPANDGHDEQHLSSASPDPRDRTQAA